MAIKKYATLNTLSNFLDNLKNLFATKTEMNTKSDKTHTHTIADVANLQSTLDGKVPTSRTINGKALSSNISLSASDIGAANTSHTHDDRYYTETEIDSKLSTKANASHNHNSVYDTKGAAADVQENLNTVSDTLDVHIDNLDIHFTTTERTKLSGIAAGAQVNTITGVKGNSESTYRTGNVNITKANIGLGNVDNTADANKSVKYATSAGSATKATQDGNGSIISSTYETKTDASAKLASAKTYADNAANAVKNDLLNGAGGAYDTLKELGDLIDDNTDAIDALEVVAAGKANKSHTHAISDVTNLQSTLDGKATSGHTHNSIASRGNTQAETETTRPSVSGLSMTQAYNNGYPQNYGNVLNLKGQGDGQLLIGWSGTSGSHAPLHVRSKRDVSDANWSDWAQIYTTAHKPTPTDIGAAASSHTHKVANITDLTATATELNYMDGVTSNVQTQLDSKQSTITGGASTITGSNLTANRALISNGSGKVAVSAVTSTELGYLDGVTSAIQTQLNEKLPKSGGTVTGALTVSNTNGSNSNGLFINRSGSATEQVRHYVDDSTYHLVYTNDETSNYVKFEMTSTDTENSDGTNKSTSVVTFSNSGNKSTVTANTFSGALSGNATSATKATQDASGNVITSTYATKTELDTTKSTLQTSINGKANSSHTHTIANITNLQTTLDGKAASSHNHSASNITSGTLSSDRLPTVPVAKGGTGATTAAAALTNLGITATAAELNKLDGVTATTAELNYVDGVTSNIQTQLNGKSSTSHTHSAAGSSLGFVKSGGDVTISSGVITVNDDSHNHTIANVDNLQTTLNGKEDVISWSAITQGQTWSRVCLVKANTGVVGWSGILSIGFTRGNVVGNATFAINASHSNTVFITQLNANKYSTFKIRGVTDSNATNTYIEIYDTANSIASGTNQTMYCKFIPLLGCTVTKYTTFTSGATIPSGYTAGSVLTVDISGGSMVASKFVGSLSGNATSATKSTQDGSGNNIVNTYATKTELNNTKSNLQTQIDGKAASSHGTHVTWATSAPKANGTAAVGTVARVAREDHVHPLQTTVSGNAGTATTISKRVKITSSQSANAGKYIKFGTITLPNGYSGFMGYLMFNPTEGSGGANGLLHLYIRNGADNTTTSCTMKWLTINDSKYEKTVFAVKVSNGIFDLYYKPINTWDTMEVIVISGDNHGTLNLANSGTYVDSITATYTSSIGGQVNYANSAGSATSATTATKLSSAKTISLTGDVTGSTSFDGSGNVSIAATVADDSHNHIIANIDNLQSALDGKSATSHTHTAESIVQMADALFGTNYLGGVEYSYGSGNTVNILTEISNMAQGLHTVYAISGTTGNPKTSESFRYLIHKTSGTIGWILAWDAQGSLFTNYQSAAGTFKGWKCVYDANPSALWTGGYYMSSSNGTPQTVTPSKKLSECRNGWVLIWSDYDPDTSTKNNTDIHHDYVFKKNCAGANWSGQCMLCDIPRYMGSDSQDVDTERRILKAIYIHDDRIEGSYQGSYDERNDVVLRAVYEF